MNAGSSFSTLLPGGRMRSDSHSHAGEIALLRDIPRTATVVSLTEVHLSALERDDFLEALTGLIASREAADVVVNARLGGDTPAPSRS